MTVVVDASALVATLVGRDADGLWSERVLASELLAGPEIVPAEASNVLRRLEQRGALTTAEAANAHVRLGEVSMALYSFNPFAERVWELRNNLSSYDAWYVALAEALDCPLVTLDLKLSRSPGPACTFLTPPGEDV
ncbi:MAG: type II toxin-antitoxin system VapC family toxin [Chloroflexi bacterium]|nr:type II toxin-antitoxin system VapC family toxin [Chloroflexota bacterium]